ncbi:MAG TPA: TetR/AcrR family transcriptional regulator [Ktedonobacteraceae bacterium]
MSPRTEETNQHIREEQRERILEAAQKLFAHKGFTDTKMTDIAAAAKISYGLAYHYFANKEEIFTRLVEWAFKGTTNLLLRARQQPGTPWDRLHWLVTEILAGAQQEPEAFMVILQAFTNDTVPQEAREIARQQSEVSQATLKQLVQEGQAAGQVVAGDPDQLVTAFSWCLTGLALDMSFLERPASPLPDADNVLRILKA